MPECPNCKSTKSFYNSHPDRKAIYNGCHKCKIAWLNKNATLKNTEITEKELQNLEKRIVPEEVDA